MCQSENFLLPQRRLLSGLISRKLYRPTTLHFYFLFWPEPPLVLKRSVVPCSLNGLLLGSLLDTEAFDNVVDKKVAESLGLKPRGGTSVVSMASGKLNAKILGEISGSLQIQERNYFDVTLGVVPDLCSDIVLGQSFIEQA